MPKGKDCPGAHKQNFFFVKAYNRMHFNVRKSAAAIDCGVSLTNSEKQSFSPVHVLFPDYAQSYMCKISDALYSLVSKIKNLKDMPGICKKNLLFFLPI